MCSSRDWLKPKFWIGAAADMPPSATVNVVRYSALAGGILYGILHRRTINHKQAQEREHAELRKREGWVEQARKEYARQKLEREGGADSVISDPNNPAFDLEKLLLKYEATK
ncbi:uncharacterized protein L969DRAFT_50006 [Mixia osmundae IAM 14324]|uniref:ATP synthase F(0) complex subunit e, mitochondrial n=1 Tax=Mixia osmundae (strain CBS 9802 / IAM 14324 / JCM 22182 / KY 12970) TaxID=764103 RepID=G7E207_MIXOS|nr:uncharacterized protein L969DRAFT_50006 [Mixia osmundae IAM 14324]KEI38697.1 hypothetical protein L969DRAFT_50006 [Mixia osmundae IAM 14324]GAA96844.1 hypothetical protein E5Q_03517 [Mixia osmundae IAM 14324]